MAMIELSLASLASHELGPNVCDLLGVVTFFPQGIDEKNLDWLVPTIHGIKGIFEKFCSLSLTYRSNNFIMMLAPIRDYFHFRGRQAPSILRATKDRYFARIRKMAVNCFLTCPFRYFSSLIPPFIAIFGPSTSIIS